MDSITTIDNVRPAAEDVLENRPDRTWTLAAVRRDVERGLISSFSIHIHDEVEFFFYTLAIHSALATDGGGMLVDARTGRIRKFKTLDAAYSSIRQTGARCDQFLGSVK